jgi:hypothetical protein
VIFELNFQRKKATATIVQRLMNNVVSGDISILYQTSVIKKSVESDAITNTCAKSNVLNLNVLVISKESDVLAVSSIVSINIESHEPTAISNSDCSFASLLASITFKTSSSLINSAIEVLSVVADNFMCLIVKI